MSIRIAQLEGCARCHGEGHADLEFFELTHPVVAGDGATIIATHWAMCPDVDEPIMMLAFPLLPGAPDHAPDCGRRDEHSPPGECAVD